MTSPFEELEYLAEFLPEEGESVLVTRRRGELVCESYQEPRDNSEPRLEGISDSTQYGRLLHARTRMSTSYWPIVGVAVLVAYWSCLAVHLITGLGWSGWYLDVGICLVTACAVFMLVHLQNWKRFEVDVLPAIHQVLADSDMDRYELLTALQQHRELRPLVWYLSRWSGN